MKSKREKRATRVQPSMVQNSWEYMGLMNGVQLNWETLDMSDITPNALALGLSIEPRYAGQIGRHYSVAAHSMLCAFIYIRTEGESLIVPEIVLGLLMHDAHESFLKDMPTSIKAFLPDYQALEHRVERALWKSYGIEGIMDTYAKTIKRYDLMALQTERNHFKFDPRGDWSHLGADCRSPLCLTYLEMDSRSAAKAWLTNVLHYAQLCDAQEFADRAT